MAWPVLTIGARTFPIVLNQRAFYRCSVLGYDVVQILNSLNTPGPDARRFAMVLQLLSACTAASFTSAIPRQEPWTAEQWADFLDAVVPADQYGDTLGQITKALMAALVKYQSDRTKTTAPTPTPEIQAVPKEPVQ